MRSPACLSRADCRPRLRRLAPWIFLAIALGGSVSWIRRPGDFAGYLLVGELALAGRHIYEESPPGINTWPPFFSLWCVPLALLARPSPYLARGLWLALNLGLLWAALKMLSRLVCRRPLHFRPTDADLSMAAPEIWLALALCYRFVLGNFDHLQVNIALFAATLAGIYWHARGHDLRAGLALGCAAALKVMPVLFVPYFLYRRRYRVATIAAAATAAFSLSPIVVYGGPRFLDYVHAWRDAVALGWGVGRMNQSVYAMFDRLLGHGFTPFQVSPVHSLPASGTPWAAVATGALAVTVAALALWTFRGRYAPDGPATLAECSVVFIAAAVFGPVAWKAYLVVLLCPCMLLIHMVRTRQVSPGERQVVLTALAMYFVLGGLPAPGLVGRRVSNALEMLSVTTVATLVLLGTLLWLRARMGVEASGDGEYARREPPCPPTPTELPPTATLR